MGGLMTKSEQALEICDKILEGVELQTLSTSSVLLLCLRVARLLNDTEALIWLQYENSGYPLTEDGHVVSSAWKIAYDNGRGGYNKDKKKIIFTELASEIESKISSQKSAIGNFSTEGASVSGEWAMRAMNDLTTTVTSSTGALLKGISENEKKLSILRGKYYDYALKKHIELSFSNTTADIFSTYRETVDNHFSKLPAEILVKLQAIEDKINSGNAELYSQALTTCRRLFVSVADELFEKLFPDYKEKTYTTKSGKEIDISGDHSLNKLSAVIETLQDKSSDKTLVGSNIIYLLDWMKNLNDLQCKGVHSEITKEDAMTCIIHTYICLGDILSLL